MEYEQKKIDTSSNKLVGFLGVVLLLLYLVLLSLLSIYGLIQFLPTSTQVKTNIELSQVTYIIWSMSISTEIRLLITVAIAGMLGSLVHAFRSLYWYIGNRNLIRSWIPKYLLLPFVGATLGLSFYLIIRGGFFSAGANVDQTNPYGFIALGVLIGMFSEQAILKLKEIAETLFSKPQPGSDSTPDTKANKN